MVRAHVRIGHDIVRKIRAWWSGRSRAAASRALRWRGGYPDGIAKDDIPLAARIVAVADSYGAMLDRAVTRSRTRTNGRAPSYSAVPGRSLIRGGRGLHARHGAPTGQEDEAEELRIGCEVLLDLPPREQTAVADALAHR